MSDVLQERLAQCCVRVSGARSGTGFYVTPTHVLTCAHVVGTDSQRGDSSILINEDPTVETTLVAICPDEDDDIALLQVSKSSGNWVWLNDDDLVLNDLLAVSGYPNRVADTRTAHYEGPRFPRDRRQYNLKNSEIIPGFSGSPVINLRTGGVIGVLSDTRRLGSDLGGWVISTLLIRKLFGDEIKEVDPASSSARGWLRLARERSARIRLDSGPQRALPAAALIESFLGFYRDERTRFGFGGRGSQMRELDKWLRASDSPYALLIAPAGRGKSSLLVNWFDALATGDRPRKLDIVFVPISIRVGLNSEIDVLRALAARLENIAGRTADNGERLDDLRNRIAECLQDSCKADTDLLVIIDGVDEADGWQFGTGLFPRRPGAGIKILLSAREQLNRKVQYWRDALAWPDAHAFELPVLSRDDIRELFSTAPSFLGSRDEQFISDFYNVTDKGDPLLVGLYLKDLKTNPHVSLKNRPSGLEAFFAAWWEQQEKLWGSDLGSISRHVRTVFNLMAVSFAPLERRDLIRLARRLVEAFDGDDLDGALRRLARFVIRVPDDERETYGLAHPRFGEYRLELLKRDDTYPQLEQFFLDWGHATRSAWDGDAAPREVSQYIVRNYGHHLIRASRPVIELRSLLTPAWRRAWDALGNDYDGFYRDARLVLSACAAKSVEELAVDRAATAVSTAWQAAYSLSERTSFTIQVDPQLVGSLVQFGLWSAYRAMSVVPLLETPTAQAKTLAAILPHIPGPLLSRAEQLLVDIRTPMQEDIAGALSAYCIKLHTTGEQSRSIEFARQWHAGVARAVGLVNLAGLQKTTEQRSQLIIDAFRDVPQLSGIEIHRVMDAFKSAFRDAVNFESGADGWVTPGLTEEARSECLQKVDASVQSRIGGGLRPPEEIDFVGYRLPWLRQSDASRLLDRLIDDLERRSTWRFVADAFIDDIPPFLSSDQASRAAELASVRLEGVDRARAIAALLPVLPELKRPAKMALLGDAATLLLTTLGGSEEEDLARRLVLLGFGNSVLARIAEESRENPQRAESLLAAIAAQLDRGGVQEAMRIVARLPQSFRDLASPKLLGRSSTLGRDDAEEALSLTFSTPSKLVARTIRPALPGAPSDCGERNELIYQLLSVRDRQVTLLGLLAAAGDPGELTAQKFERQGLRPNEPAELPIAYALVPHLSVDALMDDATWSFFERVGVTGPDQRRAVRAFCHRVIAYLDVDTLRSELIGFGRSSNWLRDCVVRAAAALHPDLVRVTFGQWDLRAVIENDGEDDGWPHIEKLAAARFAIGDTPWQTLWPPLVGRRDAWWVQLHCHRIAAVLDNVPLDAGQKIFDDTFRDTVTDAKWVQTWTHADVLPELLAYYPAGWLELIADESRKKRSSTDRSQAFAALAFRHATLGRTDEAQRYLATSSDDDAARVASRIVETCTPSVLKEWVQYTQRALHDSAEYWRVCDALRQRWPQLSRAQTLELCLAWLEAVTKRPQRTALLELIAFAPGLQQLGGVDILNSVVSTL